MRKDDRRAALAAYKERKVASGIYAVRCAGDGRRWVGASQDLSKVQNRLWFGLRLDVSPHRDMQASWRAHGAGSFSFEEVERLPEEADVYLRDSRLRDRLTHWRAELGAAAI